MDGPTQPARLIVSNQSVTDRFWQKVGPATQSGCREWTGAVAARGYGSFELNGRSVRAHRLAYQLATGRDPGELLVRHSCDNPLCCESRHLELGTPRDNTADAVRRGRMASGARNGRARLTEGQVAEVRLLLAEGYGQADIARRFKVVPSTIRWIAKGTTWMAVA